ncbi:cryptochrome/photolyase family protein [Methanothermobacter marburgensis]|uniref:cryptochrome/photolyase family protein n=1 Tax=Methanothermobacter marburgensis TaxID=145263 RepID=UPI0035BAFFF1
MPGESMAVVFPHHLMENHPAAEKTSDFIVVEDQLFFGDPVFNLRFHKNKLLLHRASMRYYYDHLKSRGLNVSYIDYTPDPDMGYLRDHLEGYERVYTLELLDHELERRLGRLCSETGTELVEIEGPFIFRRRLMDSYFRDGRFFLTSFYIRERRRLSILMENSRPKGGKWTFDRENRRRLPRGINIPEPIELPENSYVREARSYVAERFHDNPGSMEHFNYPTTHREARIFLRDFTGRRLRNFGSYQDFISRDETFLFHSVLSSSLNICLLTPMEVLKAALSADAPLNSVEGFVRQVMGWREFIRAVYILRGSYQRTRNFFNHRGKLNHKMYLGNTGLEPYDTAVRRVLRHGYTHHIERLMVIGNLMLLLGTDPDEVYRWFMEMFIDSYDWVMVPNVYGMSQYADGGLMATKPYISSSNYILRMSDHARGDWCRVWDSLFWTFLSDKRNYIGENPRMRLLYRYLTDEKLEDLQTVKKRFLDELRGP